MRRIVLITGDTLGRGEEELGARLMGSFLRMLLSTTPQPDALVFYNTGVKLLAPDSAVLDVLDEVNRAGVRLVACGTCVTYFALAERIAPERVSNMAEIAALLLAAENVITV
jgi:intracellular sulfur oxidation DsrE/DsrF family protein